MRTRRPKPCVAGFDLSLSRPAACLIPPGWELGDWSTLVVEALDVGEIDSEGLTTEELQRKRYARLIRISGWARDFVLAQPVRPTLVLVENYGFSKSSSSVTKLAELGGVVRVELLAYGKVMIPVPASEARKLLLGQVPRRDQKLAVQGALYRAGAPLSPDLTRKWKNTPPACGGRGTWGEDECDAVAVANLGLAICGLRALTLA